MKWWFSVLLLALACIVAIQAETQVASWLSTDTGCNNGGGRCIGRSGLTSCSNVIGQLDCSSDEVCCMSIKESDTEEPDVDDDGAERKRKIGARLFGWCGFSLWNEWRCRKHHGGRCKRGHRCYRDTVTFTYGCHTCHCCLSECAMTATELCKNANGVCRKHCYSEERIINDGCTGRECQCCADASVQLCLLQPCFPGVQCTDTTRAPYFTCGACPDGLTGDGVRCERKRCEVGFAGNGVICGPDNDLDGFPEVELSCCEPNCRKDNCVCKPNSGQENADGDVFGDACDSDDDNDTIRDASDNCPLVINLDQANSDSDDMGDACDDCRDIDNDANQRDSDNDGTPDACDDDIDNDGSTNDIDNCPTINNPSQEDSDNDQVGDLCDNCPDVANWNQDDSDKDFIGDACEDPTDSDQDGLQDNRDNCPNVANSDQLDTDNDGEGDVCDDDIDDDGVPNDSDNCPLVSNADQQDLNADCVGDICFGDIDGDGIPDHVDTCPNNAMIFRTNFSPSIHMEFAVPGDRSFNWVITDEGREIRQTKDTDPVSAVGNDAFGGVNFEGTLFVDTTSDDDFIGFIFSLQDNAHFYVVTWKMDSQRSRKGNLTARGEAGLQLKLVKSVTGPGYRLRYALYHSQEVADQTSILWENPNTVWESRTAYRWRLLHRPNIGLIRVRIFLGNTLLADSGNIYNSELKGGKLGVYCLSQKKVIWSHMDTRCTDDVPETVFNELPPGLQNLTNIDNLNSLVTGF